MKKSENTTTLQPSSKQRGNANFAVIIATRNWTEQAMPAQVPRHPECKRNEIFLMNVHPIEFAWFASGHVWMQDFKKIRLGDKAYLTGTTQEVGAGLGYKPMFGALRRGARLRRKEKKTEKKKKAKEK